MLARNAASKVASSVPLEFVVPRLFCRGKSTHKATSRPVKPELNDGAQDSRRVVPPLPSTSPSRLNPAQLLSQLDRQLQKFHGQPLEGLTDSQVEIFNVATAELRSAAEYTDLDKAWQVWMALKKRNLLRFFGRSHHDMSSRLVAAVCDAKGTAGSWDPAEFDILEEIAVVAAAGGASEGLKVLMLTYIRRANPQAVLKLYSHYWALLGEKTVWKEADESVEADEEEEHRSSDPATQSAAYSLVHGDILLSVITAHAMQNTFMDALDTSLQTAIRFSPGSLREFLKLLRDDTELLRKAGDYARRLEIARLVARRSSLSKQLSNLTRDHAIFSLQRLYSGIIEGLTSAPPWLSLQNSDSGTKMPVFVPEFTWASFITGFLYCRRKDLAEKLWDDALRLGVKPDVIMWTALIDGYAELKEVTEAIGAWDMMIAQGIKPEASTYRALIYALYHAGRPEEAFQRFQAFKANLPKLSPSPDQSTILFVYNTTLHGLLFHSQEADAHALLKEMQSKGPKPDIVTFNNFLRYYGRKGQLKSLADILQMIEPAGLVGDVYTFSIILSALLKVRDDAPEIMFNLMERQGVKPNAASLTTIIDHQMKAQTESSFRTALELLTKMERNEGQDAQPNEVTYTSILTGIHRGNWLPRQVVEEYRQLMWAKIEARGIIPKRVTYNILIKACLENPAPEGVQDALRYYRDMLRRRIFIANDTWYIMLYALVSRKEWTLANELVEDIQKSGFMPAGPCLTW